MKKLLTVSLGLLLTVGLSTSLTGQLKVVSTGDVGIGESNPLVQLHLTKDAFDIPGFVVDAQTGGTTVNFIKSLSGPNGSGLFFDKANFLSFSPADGILDETTDFPNSLIVRLNGVGVGVSNPTEKLDVNGNIKVSGMIITSDKRLKENVEPYNKGLDVVMKLNPIRYNYNNELRSIDKDMHIGLYAQELQSVAPEMVKSFEHIEVSSDMSQRAEVLSRQKYLAIKDNEVKYLLLNAIKEQQGIIEELVEKVSKLESLVNEIEKEAQRTEAVINGVSTSKLGQNSPNPHNGFTQISYVLGESNKNAIINVFDTRGLKIKTIELDRYNREGTVDLKTTNLAPGTYFYSLIVDDQIIDTKKMLIAK